VDEVESFVYHSRDENVFSLHRKLVDGDFDGALEVLSKIEGSGEANPAQLIGGLAFQTRRLIALRSLLDNGFSQEEAFKRLNIRGKRIQSDYRDAISRFGSSELRRQMVQLVQFEAAIREHGNAIQSLLLELLVYRLVFPGEELLSSDDRAFA
jgi:DNA polymerase-3 subunit delta